MTKSFFKPALLISLCGIIVFSLVTSAFAAGEKEDLLARQAQVHEVAEMARALDLPEDDPIILRAQELWWEFQAEIEAANTPEMKSLGTYRITGYDPFCSHCCGKSNGITASGTLASVGRTVAMSGIPFGTEIYIEGLGYYVVEDRGVGRGFVDVACSGHSECYDITGRYNVYIVER